MILWLVAFLLCGHAHAVINKFEQENNRILLQATGIIKSGKNTEELNKLEAAYKRNIERDIFYQLSHMPKSLKGSLGNFKQSYHKFKKKISLIHASVKSVCSVYIQQEDFLFTILGLKPVSIEPINASIARFNKAYDIVNNHYPHELSRGKVVEKM